MNRCETAVRWPDARASAPSHVHERGGGRRLRAQRSHVRQGQPDIDDARQQDGSHAEDSVPDPANCAGFLARSPRITRRPRCARRAPGAWRRRQFSAVHDRQRRRTGPAVGSGPPRQRFPRLTGLHDVEGEARWLNARGLGLGQRAERLDGRGKRAGNAVVIVATASPPTT